MKKIFKAIANTFINKYVKALYITIFIFIAIGAFIALIYFFPIIIGIMIILTLFALVYFLVLYEL